MTYDSGLIDTAVPAGRMIGVSCRVRLSPDATVANLRIGLAEGLFTAAHLDKLIDELTHVRSLTGSRPTCT